MCAAASLPARLRLLEALAAGLLDESKEVAAGAELEAEDIEEMKKGLPKLKRAAFQREIDQLQAPGDQQVTNLAPLAVVLLPLP